EQRGHLRATERNVRTNVDELLSRSLAAPFEPFDLVGEPRLGNLISQHVRALNQNHRPARHDAGRDADAAQALHFPHSRPPPCAPEAGASSSPKPEATSATSASRASPSSDPSALIVIVVPRAAASSRIPMMLFPSIWRASLATRTRAWYFVARWTNFAAARACIPSWFTTVTDREVIRGRVTG